MVQHGATWCKMVQDGAWGGNARQLSRGRGQDNISHWRATKGESTLKSKLTLTAELALSGKNVIPSNYHGHFQLISEQILDQ